MMNVTIEDSLKKALGPELARLNHSLMEIARTSGGYLGELLSVVLSGSGKRVRPSLVFLGARLGEAPPDVVLGVAEIIELIHIATLVHDDVIDGATLRRGRKTVVAQHGVDTAVLLGDQIYTQAFERLAKLNQPKILELVSVSAAHTCLGEIEQLKRRYKFDLSEEDYYSFIERKTAALFGVSVRSGALLAGQSEAVQKAVESYGSHMGIAFQIIDDMLDLVGKEDVVGKTLRTDILNGKMTLPLIHFRDSRGSVGEIEALFKSLQHPNGHVNQLIKDLKKTGSLDYASAAAKRHVHLAISALAPAPAGEAKDFLAGLADMLLRRTA